MSKRNGLGISWPVQKQGAGLAGGSYRQVPAKENDLMKRYPNISFLAGILAVVCYLLCTVLALIRYPMPYSPMTNWLSDLGNVNLNPNGAIFYNIGIVSAGLLLVLFFLRLSKWRIQNKKPQIIMLLLAQIFGVLGSISMVMTGVYPINFLEIHSLWSSSLYITLATSFVFLAAALRYHENVPRWLLLLALLPAPIVILTSLLPTMYVLEWITVLLFLTIVFLVGVETKRLRSEPVGEVTEEKIVD